MRRANKEGVKISKKTLDGRAKVEETISKLRVQLENNSFQAIQDFDVRRENLDIDFQKGVEDREKTRTDKF